MRIIDYYGDIKELEVVGTLMCKNCGFSFQVDETKPPKELKKGHFVSSHFYQQYIDCCKNQDFRYIQEPIYGYGYWYEEWKFQANGKTSAG